MHTEQERDLRLPTFASRNVSSGRGFPIKLPPLQLSASKETFLSVSLSQNFPTAGSRRLYYSARERQVEDEFPKLYSQSSFFSRVTIERRCAASTHTSTSGVSGGSCALRNWAGTAAARVQADNGDPSSALASGTIAAARCRALPVTTLAFCSIRSWSTSAWSRYATNTYAAPRETEPAHFIDRLMQIGAARPGQILLPTSDETAWLYSKHADLTRAALLR